MAAPASMRATAPSVRHRVSTAVESEPAVLASTSTRSLRRMSSIILPSAESASGSLGERCDTYEGSKRWPSLVPENPTAVEVGPGWHR
eukprot:scaffold106501_cov30-Tisochrysis_lutea.AAC.5